MGLNDNDRAIASFTMLGHALVHWFELSIPILLVVWREEFPDVSLAFIGLIVALGYAPFGLGALPGGVLADRYGPKRLVLACFGGMSLAFLSLSVATSIYLIGAALVLWGIAASIYHPAGMALISTGTEQQGTVFAYHGIAGNIGITLGPFAAATLLIFFQWQLVAALLAVPGLVGLLYGLRADFDTTAGVEEDVDASAGTPLTLSTFLSNSWTMLTSAFLVVFIIVSFEGLFYRGVLTFLPDILQGLSVIESIDLGSGLAGIGVGDYVFVGLLVVGMAGQYVGGKLTDRMPVERGLVGIFGILAVLAVIFVPATALGFVPLLAYCALLGFFLFAVQPFYQVAVAQYTPPDTRGLSYGFTYLGEFGFGAVSIAIGGAVIGAIGVGAFFVVLAGFAVISASLSALLLFGSDRIDFLDSYEAEAAD